MSTVVLSLFGDEIIPEQVNAVGKSRAARKPKAALSPKETEPEPAGKEVGQDAIETVQEVVSSAWQPTPEIYPEAVDVTEVVQEVTAPAPPPIQEAPPSVAEIIQDVQEVVISAPQAIQEVPVPVVDVIKQVQHVATSAPPPIPQTAPPPIPQTAPQAVEEIRAMPQITTPVQQFIQAVPNKAVEITEVVEKRPKPAVKKAKPAAKKPVAKAAKKEIVKKEKPEGRPILEGWTPDKQYYSIGEVASLFYVATSHIRFWTNEFALKVRTTRKGDRLYSPEQINELRTIYHLVKEKGYTIAGAKARLKDAKKTPVHTLDLKQSLLQLRNKLVDIKNQL